MSNSYIRIILGVLCLGFIFSCSSTDSDKKEKPASQAELTSESYAEDVSPDQGPEAVPKKKQSIAKRAESKPKSGEDKTAQLDEALHSQNDDQIIRAASHVLMTQPQDLKALNSMAMAYYRKGRYSLSASILKKILVNNQNNSAIHSNLGVVLLAQGDKREAAQSFKRALQVNSEDSVAAANLGSIYAQEKNFAKARMTLEIAYRQGFREIKVLNNYAVALSAEKQFEKSEEVYQEILKKQPSHREALYNFAILLVENMKKYNEGLEIIQKLKLFGGPGDSRSRIIALENKAKAGLK